MPSVLYKVVIREHTSEAWGVVSQHKDSPCQAAATLGRHGARDIERQREREKDKDRERQRDTHIGRARDRERETE